MSSRTLHTEYYRLAPYVETHHRNHLDSISREIVLGNEQNPYIQFPNIEFDEGFFGYGYMLSGFPSVCDMYGKFMAGLDISILFNQLFEESKTSIKLLSKYEHSCLMNIIEGTVIPAFGQGVLDINYMLGGAFREGRDIIRAAGEKAIEKFRTTLKYKMLFIITEQWKMHLEWNKDVVSIYLEFYKLYTEQTMRKDEHNQQIRLKEALWPFKLLEYQRSALNVLMDSHHIAGRPQPAGPKEQKQWVKSLSGAVSGAIMGAQIGGWVGAIIGAIIGLALSFF